MRSLLVIVFDVLPHFTKNAFSDYRTLYQELKKAESELFLEMLP